MLLFLSTIFFEKFFGKNENFVISIEISNIWESRYWLDDHVGMADR